LSLTFCPSRLSARLFKEAGLNGSQLQLSENVLKRDASARDGCQPIRLSKTFESCSSVSEPG